MQNTAQTSDKEQPGSHPCEPVNDPNWLQLSSHAVQVVTSFAQLALLELNLTLHTIPKLLGVVMMSLFFAICTWLSFGITVAWGVYALTGTVFYGLLVFFALQLMALITCIVMKKKFSHSIGLPHTREQWQSLKGSLHEAFGTH